MDNWMQRYLPIGKGEVKITLKGGRGGLPDNHAAPGATSPILVRRRLYLLSAYFGSSTSLRTAAKIFRIATWLPWLAMKAGMAPPVSLWIR